jgi:hypothetical protein
VYIFCIYENIYVVYISIYIHNIRVSYKNIYTGGGGFGVYTAYIFSYDFIRYFHTMKIYTQEGEVLVTLVPSLPRHRTLQVTDCLEVSHSASLYMCVLCVQGRSLSLRVFRSLARSRARSLSLARPPARARSRCVCVCVCVHVLVHIALITHALMNKHSVQIRIRHNSVSSSSPLRACAVSTSQRRTTRRRGPCRNGRGGRGREGAFVCPGKTARISNLMRRMG